MSKTVSTPYKTQRYNITFEVPAPPYKGTLLTRLETYIERQAAGQNRFKWMGISMLFHGAIITPIVATVILYTGCWTPLWFMAAASVYATFIPGFTGSPAKWVMTVFFTNIGVNLLIIAAALLHAAIT